MARRIISNVEVILGESMFFFCLLSRIPAAEAFRERSCERERSSPSSRGTTRFTSHFASRGTKQPRIISTPDLSEARETGSSTRESPVERSAISFSAARRRTRRRGVRFLHGAKPDRRGRGAGCSLARRARARARTHAIAILTE